MRFVSINIIDSCFRETKKFLFPINKKLWLKLGLVTLLAGGASSGLSNFNLNLNDFTGFQQIIQTILDNLHLVILGAAGMLIAGIIFAVISALFNFVLIDSIEKKRCLIKKSLSENSHLALSYFVFSFIINFFFTLLSAAIIAPVIIRLYSIMDNPSGIFKYPYFWVAIPLLILVIAIAGLIRSIIYNFVMVDMYIKRNNFIKAWRRMSLLFAKNLLDVIVYWIMKFLFGLAAGIIGIIVILVLLFIFAVIGLMLLGIGLLICYLAKILIIPLAVIGVLLAICLFIAYIYSIAVVLVPVQVFFTDYRLEFYKGLARFG